MRMQDVKNELTVISNFVEDYVNTPGLEDLTHYRDLLTRAKEAFVDYVGTRKECEACVTELIQFRRALELITAGNEKLKDQTNYLRDFLKSVAALKRVAAAVRLHFLLQDLQAIVDEQ